MNSVIFSHGKESGPNGTKIQVLSRVAESNGFEVLSLDYTDCRNAGERVERLYDTLSEKDSADTVLVGSSMGGYVATVVATAFPVKGLFVLCPALYLPMDEYAVQDYSPKSDHIEIVHGWEDEVVPFESSVRFGKETNAVLNLVHDNHRLSNSHEFLAHRFDHFLKRIVHQ